MGHDGYVKVAVMGATGTGKSTFIRHLTNDAKIHIGHNPDSETSEVQTSYYTDTTTGRSIMLIDTPGFDDSRAGITDVDILQKLIDFLQPKKNEGNKLNGIIYMYRISDPRVGGLARKNLRMFEALCGEKSLRNVRVVSTNWDRLTTEREGLEREEHLKNGAFQPLLMSGAQMRRYSNNTRSAQEIMNELIPLGAVSTRLQDQVAEGKALGDTDAGRIINKDIEELKRKHAEELASLRGEMEEAIRVHDEALRAELDDERKILEERVRRAEEDQMRLRMTIDTLHEQQKAGQEESKYWRAILEEQSAKLQQDRAQWKAEEDMRQMRDQLNRQGQFLADMRQQEMKRVAAEAEQKAKVLHEQITALEADKLKVEDYANRGVFGRFLHDVASVTEECAEDGIRNAGPIGGMVGAVVGLGVSPFVAGKRALVGK